MGAEEWGGRKGKDTFTTPLATTQFAVSVDNLREFQAFLARELDTNLRPGATSINNEHSIGVDFGSMNAGEQVQAARTRYWDALRSASATLAAYIDTSEILIAAIQSVANRYADTDVNAAMAIDFRGELSTAIATVTRERQEQATREREQETQRELHRMNAGSST